MPALRPINDDDSSRPRRRKLRSLAFLPTLITLGNLTCGFAAIYFSMRAMYELGAGRGSGLGLAIHSAALERMLPSFLSFGAGLVFLGMIFDAFDGLVARATRTTTNFGGQLDSLADVVTCGVAPAILMVAFMIQELSPDGVVASPISEHFLGRACWVAAAIYVAFAAIRLARFNVEHAEAGFDHRTFRGLPSPGAAAILASLVLFQDQLGAGGRQIVAYVFPFVAIAAAFLMVSRIPYRRFYRAYLLGKQPFWQIVAVTVVIAVFMSYKTPTLLVIVVWYGMSGPTFLVVRRVREMFRPTAAESKDDKQSFDRKTG